MIVAPELGGIGSLAAAYLERQAWYHAVVGHEGGEDVALLSAEVLRPGSPGLARLVLGRGGSRFQLLVGSRPPAEAAEVLGSREAALLGQLTVAGATVLAYDALADDELCVELLVHVTGGSQRASMVRRVSTLVSHASLVFDERLFMKCYRVLEPGARPEVEVMLRLDEVGFNAMLAPVAHWREDGYDLALVREFQPSALEGRLLAFTSLRDLLAHACAPDDSQPVERAPSEAARARADPDAETAAAGGDLAAEMRRLGSTTARLHLALAEVFGDVPATRETFAAAVGDETGRVERELAGLRDDAAGRVVRLHGDYHLRRVMRSEAGWLVAGFGDDPLNGTDAAGSSLTGRRGSPLEDIADMCASLKMVAREALAQRAPEEAETATHLADAWIRRNETAFLDGYVGTDGASRLLPDDPALVGLLLAGFGRERMLRYEATSSEA